MSKKGVLILECLDTSDPGSEGRFLANMFDIMCVEYQYVEIRTKAQFICLLQKSPYHIIHISTHGSVRQKGKSENFSGLWTRDGEISIRNLKTLEGKLNGYIIVSTACLSADNSFAKYLMNTAGCDHYIAPIGSPRFYNAIFFAHIFYHKYFILNKDVDVILEEYDKKYKNPHSFISVSFEDFIKKTID